MATVAVTGGHVLLPDMSVERGDVLVDQEQGKILAVGEDLSGDRIISAEGSLVMPGMVNGHTHAAMTLLRGYADDKPLDRWLQEDIWPAEAVLEPADVRAGTELALVEMIRSGTTAFADMYFHMGEVVEAVEQAGLRARLSHGVVTVGKSAGDAEADIEEGIEFAAAHDGAADGRIRTAVSPHSLTTVSESGLRDLVERARDLGVSLHYHANETEAEVEPITSERGIRPMEFADDIGMVTEDDFLAHGVHLDGSEIELLANRGSSIVHCPASNMKLASGMAPVAALLEARVPVALGTDGPASNNDLDLFDEMRDAAMLGKLAAGRADAVPAEAVVGMATAGGAAALGFEGGVLAEGAPADLIVVDFEEPRLTPVHDRVSHLAYAASGSDVCHTMVDGELLMRDREVLPFDTHAVREEASRRAATISDRV